MVHIDMFDESTTTMVLGGSPARSGFMEEADSTKARSLSDGRKPWPMGGTPQTPKTHTSDTSDTSGALPGLPHSPDRKSTRLNSSHLGISYAVFCLKTKN